MSHDSMQSEQQQARQELERIRQGVRVAPAPEIDGAPDWLYGIEEMRDFFSSVAPVWDRVFGTDREDQLYRSVATKVVPTDSALSILVLGCGTGLELDAIFARAPNARITGIDLAAGMLAELRRKYHGRMAQIELIEGSYVDRSFGDGNYDYVIATLTVHHLAPSTKLALYRTVRRSLKPHGLYIEGDQSTDPATEREILRWYGEYVAKLPGGDSAAWNYDITLCPETEERLLREASFAQVKMTWRQNETPTQGLAVFIAGA